ncbi:MAG: nitronate monooxygenase family protein [Candidatus Dormiibacterota bacterium]
MRTEICDRLGIEFPIFAFSHCRDVVAAVSKAGGLGMLGALVFSPEQLEIELNWIDEHVGGKPYGVDVVMPAKYEGADLTGKDLEGTLRGMIPATHVEYVEEILTRYGVAPLPPDEPKPKALLGWSEGAGRSQVDIALQHPIKLIANALGPPPEDVVVQAHEHGVLVAGLVGDANQARKQVEVGVDIIIASGTEAGGHTGEVATFVLVPEVVDAISPVPVLAAGGIGDGRQVAAALALGAQGVWTGSIWLTVAEADTTPLIREKLLAAGSRDTVRSRALTGKPARQLRTAWTDAWDDPNGPGPLPMPLQFMLTAEAQHRIGRSGNKELAGMPVGQIVGRMNSIRTTQDVMYGLVEGCIKTIEEMQAKLGSAVG